MNKKGPTQKARSIHLKEVLDGEAHLTIGGKSIIAPCGSLVIMPAGVPHAVKAQKRFKMLLTMIRS